MAIVDLSLYCIIGIDSGQVCFHFKRLLRYPFWPNGRSGCQSRLCVFGVKCI